MKLSNHNYAAALRRAGNGAEALRATVTRNAERHAQVKAGVIADIEASGATSRRALAAELNARGMLTRRGGHWHFSTVEDLLRRLEGQSDCDGSEC